MAQHVFEQFKFTGPGAAPKIHDGPSQAGPAATSKTKRVRGQPLACPPVNDMGVVDSLLARSWKHEPPGESRNKLRHSNSERSPPASPSGLAEAPQSVSSEVGPAEETQMQLAASRRVCHTSAEERTGQPGQPREQSADAANGDVTEADTSGSQASSGGMRWGGGGCSSGEDVEDLAGRGALERGFNAAKRRRARGGQPAGQLGQPPAEWKEVLARIREMRVDRNAPVDLFGTRQLVDPMAEEETQRFHALVAAMLSSQTRDAATAAAMARLKAMPGGLTVGQVAHRETTVAQLEQLVQPVGFYRQKAQRLKAIGERLAAAPHNGRVPSTMEDLISLPGVGPKVALLVQLVAFNKPERGLIVDTHVRRVCGRLGWLPENTSPDCTRAAVEQWLPRSLWAETSFLLVGFGQQVCTPLHPKCTDCKLNQLCPSAF